MGGVQKFDVQVDADGNPIWPPLKAAPGSTLRITVETLPSTGKKYSMMDFFGTGKGLFSTPEEADRFIREERNSCDRHGEP